MTGPLTSSMAWIAAIGATLAWWGTRLLLDGLDVRMAGAALPQSIGYLPLALGGLLMVVFALLHCVLACTGERTQDGS